MFRCALPLVLTIALSAGCTNYTEPLSAELTYLSSLEEIAWVEVDHNEVFLGFRETAADLRGIVHGAALAGNRAIDFGVHVWAVRAERGWRPGSAGLICQATARGGQITQTCGAP